jgi:Zn-dependent M28 family amino/carboxypeptidase
MRFTNEARLLPGGLMRAKRLCLLGAGLLLGACSEEGVKGAEPGATASRLDSLDTAAEVISVERITAGVVELAGDDYRGRGPGTVEDRRAQAYIAGRLAALNIQPAAADGSWFQPFDLVSIEAAQPASWSFQLPDGSDAELTQGTEYIVASGVQAEQADIADSELVFVGYGIEAPEFNWNDYKGVDLTGKTLVMLNNDPDWDDELFAGERRLYYGRWTYKYESAARQGAAAAIIIHTPESAGYPWQVVQTSWSGAQFQLPATGEPRVQVAAWMTQPAASELLEKSGVSLDELVESARSWNFQPLPLGIRTSIGFDNDLKRAESANVLGMIEGSDPLLKDEVVVYTAHHDHLGVGKPNLAGDLSDVIYNGARDNASGTSMVLAVAAAYQALPEPPKRSVLFAFVGAEEQGLLGSKFYAREPTIAPGRIAANVNFDSANIWGRTRDITYVGKGKSSLDLVADEVAAYQGRVVKGDQFPSQGVYYRSDQFSFAKIGVPALYLSGGTDFVGREAGWGAAQMGAYIQQNYHQPSDELTPDWNFEGMVEDARFGFMAGWLIANDAELPRWNEGDEFEAARLEALAAVAADR